MAVLLFFLTWTTMKGEGGYESKRTFENSDSVNANIGFGHISDIVHGPSG
jgi:hypothetical protein